MGHKEPVLRPRYIGPRRARTQIPFIHSFIYQPSTLWRLHEPRQKGTKLRCFNYSHSL